MAIISNLILHKGLHIFHSYLNIGTQTGFWMIINKRFQYDGWLEVCPQVIYYYWTLQLIARSELAYIALSQLDIATSFGDMTTAHRVASLWDTPVQCNLYQQRQDVCIKYLWLGFTLRAGSGDQIRIKNAYISAETIQIQIAMQTRTESDHITANGSSFVQPSHTMHPSTYCK